MKLLHAFLTVLFITFALLQLNDPDPVLWVIAYSYIALLSLIASLGRHFLVPIIVGTVGCLAWAAVLLPGVISWLQNGAATEVFSSMTASKPYIEQTREFMGLLIILGTLVMHFFLWRKARLQA